MQQEIKFLSDTFIGKGSVKNYIFTKLRVSNRAYIYRVDTPFGTTHYEVFRRKLNLRWKTESYPGDKAFGIWAWTAKGMNEALNRFKLISR